MKSIDPWRALAVPHPHPEWFSGPVSILELSASQAPTELEVLAVFFEAGARTVPHTHETAQLLWFLEGEGIVATEEERRLYRAGGIALIPAGEWHWHGATPASPTSHLSIRPGGLSAWPPEVSRGDWDSYMTDARSG